MKNILMACCILAFLASASTACVSPEAPATQIPTPMPTVTPVPTPTPAPTPTPTQLPAATAIPTPTYAMEPMPAVPAPLSSDDLAALLGTLPANRSSVAFVDHRATSQRAGYEIGTGGPDAALLTQYTNGILDDQLARDADIQSAVFSINSWSTGAAILLGDFSSFPVALHAAVEAGEVSHRSFRGVDVFIIPRYHDLYLAMPDPGTLVAAMGEEDVSRELLEETLGLRLDGPNPLDSSLAAMLTAVGPVHFLFARYLTENEGGSPEMVFFGGAGTLNEDDTVDLAIYSEWVDEEEAQQVEARLAEYPLYGYNSGERYPYTNVNLDGTTIVARAESVLDEDVEGILLGN